MTHIIVPRTRQVSIRQDGAMVQLLVDGQLVLDIPFQAALELAAAIRTQAKKAEEIAAAPQIIMDEALLLRAGVPFSLSSHPGIRKEALKEAAWNTPLRRRVRNRMNDRTGTVFPPTVIREKKD